MCIGWEHSIIVVSVDHGRLEMLLVLALAAAAELLVIYQSLNCALQP